MCVLCVSMPPSPQHTNARTSAHVVFYICKIYLKKAKNDKHQHRINIDLDSGQVEALLSGGGWKPGKTMVVNKLVDNYQVEIQ